MSIQSVRLGNAHSKKDGTIKVCGDFKLTVNQATQTEYPLPRIDELFAFLSGGTVFSTLDLSHAYNQLLLNEKTQELTTINTHKGSYKYTWLPFGAASAPAIFQRTMETLLKDLPTTCVYIDDILVTDKMPQDYLNNLAAVLSRLQEAGLRLKKVNCSFCVSEVECLEHIISAAGLKPSPRKVRAIVEAPQPTQAKSEEPVSSYSYMRLKSVISGGGQGPSCLLRSIYI